MIHIEIRIPEIDPAHEHVGWQGVATLQADGHRHELEDPSGVVDLTLSVPNLRTGGSVHFDDDHEEWARGLPAVYRGPELLAVVISDDHPIDNGWSDIEREAVAVPETAPVAAAH